MNQTDNSILSVKRQDALNICKVCGSFGIKGCIMADIEGTKTEDLIPPKCMIPQLKKLQDRRKLVIPLRNGEPTPLLDIQKQPNKEIKKNKQETLEYIKDQNVTTIKKGTQKTESQAVTYGANFQGYDNKQRAQEQNQQNNNGDIWRKNDGYDKPQTANTGKKDKTQSAKPGANTKKNGHAQYSLSLDKLDIKILNAITNRYNQSGISKVLQRQRSTVRRRLDRMVEKGFIQELDQNIGGIKQKIYQISPKLHQEIIHNDSCLPGYEEPQAANMAEPIKDSHKPVKWTWHSCSMKTDILEGEIPKGDKSFNPRGWEGQLFFGENYKIRVIPSKTGIGTAVIDLNISLEADYEDNLLLKYHSLASSYLGQWSEKHKIKLGQIEMYREPHRVLNGSIGIAKAIMGERGGELKIPEIGMQVDKSDPQHQGELEFHGDTGKQAAQGLEFAINTMPQVIGELCLKVDKGLNDIKSWIALQEENKSLRQENEALKQQLLNFAQEIDQIKKSVGYKEPDQTKEKPETGLKKKPDKLIGYG